MRILHIGKYYAPIEGGIESINHFVVNVLKGCQQRVLSFNNQNTSREEDIENVPIIRSSLKGVFASQPLSFSYLKELRRCIQLFDPDVIHFHYPNPLGAFYLLLSIRRQNKLIVHWHSDVVAQKVLYSFIKPIEDKLLNRADVIIATSPNYANASRNLLRFKNKVVIIPCSINETLLDLKSGEEKHVQAMNERYGGKPIVFFLGRHVEYKGIIDFDKTVECLQQYFVLLFPTYYYGEGFTGNVVDAYNTGLPIIATDWLYNKDIIKDGRNGILVPPKNIEALSSALLKLYNDRHLHYQMAKNNIEDAKQYGPDEVLKDLYSIIDD